jgi:hypothetical protein
MSTKPGQLDGRCRSRWAVLRWWPGCASGADSRGGLGSAHGRAVVERLRGDPVAVVLAFLDVLGRPVRAVYEAGPTGFGLARAGAPHPGRRRRSGAAHAPPVPSSTSANPHPLPPLRSSRSLPRGHAARCRANTKPRLPPSRPSPSARRSEPRLSVADNPADGWALPVSSRHDRRVAVTAIDRQRRDRHGQAGERPSTVTRQRVTTNVAANAPVDSAR